MKKKITLALSIFALLVCMLAITAFAEDRTSISYTDIDGVTHTVPVVKYEGATAESVASALDNNVSRQSLFVDNSSYVILKAVDGTLTAYPTWYIIEPPDSASETYVVISELEYGYVNEMSGKTYERGAVRYIEFPNTMTVARNNNVFGRKANSSDYYEVNVTDMYIPKSVKTIEGGAFNSAASLKRVYIEKGSTISRIDSGTFSNSSVEYVQFENLTELVSIDGFSNTKLNGDIDLSNTKLVTVAAGAFKNSSRIQKITLPDSVETIGDAAFEDIGSGYLASPYLPKSLTSVGTRFFSYNNNLLETYIFPEGINKLPNEPFQNSRVADGKELNLVFLGEVTGTVYVNGGGHQKHAERVTVYFAQNSLDQYNKNGFYIKPSDSSVTSVPNAIRTVFCKGAGTGANGNVTGVEYVYITNTNGTSWTADMVNDATNGFDFDNHNHFGAFVTIPVSCGDNGFEGVECIVCDKQIGEVIPATGNHTVEDDGNCATEVVCSVCESVVVEALSHLLKETYSYDKGYLEAGLHEICCTNEDCTYSAKEDLQALFICNGYSVPEDGSVGIAIGFIVNNDAITAYQTATGKVISYGVYAAAQNKIGVNPVFDENGNKAEGAVESDLTFYEFTAFEIKIVGFTSEYVDSNFAIGAYVKTTDSDGFRYEYLQHGTPAEGEIYAFTTYNKIVESVKGGYEE